MNLMIYTPYIALQTLFATQEEQDENTHLSHSVLQDMLAEVSDESDPLPLVVSPGQFSTLQEHQREGRLPANVELAEPQEER